MQDFRKLKLWEKAHEISNVESRDSFNKKNVDEPCKKTEIIQSSELNAHMQKKEK